PPRARRTLAGSRARGRPIFPARHRESQRGRLRARSLRARHPSLGRDVSPTTRRRFRSRGGNPTHSRGSTMKATENLHDEGQSIGLDNITRALLQSGTLERYIRELSVTGLTSNPTIFDHAIKNSASYDAAIHDEVAKGRSGEELFFDLALEDISR